MKTRSNRRAKRLAIALSALFVLVPTAAAAGPVPLTDIIKLSAAGLGDDAIIAKIQSSGTHIELTPDQMIELRSKGVSGPVIAALITGGKSATGSHPAEQPSVVCSTKIPYRARLPHYSGHFTIANDQLIHLESHAIYLAYLSNRMIIDGSEEYFYEPSYFMVGYEMDGLKKLIFEESLSTLTSDGSAEVAVTIRNHAGIIASTRIKNLTLLFAEFPISTAARLTAPFDVEINFLGQVRSVDHFDGFSPNWPADASAEIAARDKLYTGAPFDNATGPDAKRQAGCGFAHWYPLGG